MRIVVFDGMFEHLNDVAAFHVDGHDGVPEGQGLQDVLHAHVAYASNSHGWVNRGE